MTRILLFLIILLYSTFFSIGQECDCMKNFEWVKKTFEENDAGYEYALKSKGKQAYEDHNIRTLEKLNAAKTFNECGPLLFEWLKFFRSGHIAIKRNEKSGNSNEKNEAGKNFDDWEKLNVDVPEFEKYLGTKKDPDYEGIWEVKPYKIGIKKQGNSYTGFIIESGADTWKKGQVKLRISKDGETLKVIFYLRDHSPQEFNSAELLGNNYLEIGWFKLKRISPVFPRDEKIERYYKLTASDKPFVEELNKSTLLLRVPSFDNSAKKDIDSTIAANKKKILATKNLIIDLRNNGGGSDGSYKEIIPLIYTNPIRTIGVEYLSTKLNNQRMLDFINKPEYGADEKDKKEAREAFDKLEKQLGKFVNLGSTTVEIDTLDTVYTYPQQVGIIINEANGSTTEQFLLAARQSKKVKFFGTTTYGVLDISNMYFVESPCKEFELGYSLSRSMRIPGMTIDGKGIQPDYYLDKTISPYEWTDYVNKILNGN